MIEPFSPDGPRTLLADLCGLVGRRAPEELAIVAEFHASNEAAEKHYHQSQRQLTDGYQAERTATEAAYAARRRNIREAFETAHGATEKQYATARNEALGRFENDRIAAEQERQEAQWEATTIAEAAKGGSSLQLHDFHAQLDSRWQELQAIARQTVELLHRRGQWRNFPEPAVGGPLLERHPMQRFTQALEQARAQFRALAAQKTPRLFEGLWRMLALFLLLWSLAIYPAEACLNLYGWGWYDWPWMAASGGSALTVFLILLAWLHVVVRRHTAAAYLPLRQTLLEAGLERPGVLETAHADCQRLFVAIAARHDAEIKQTDAKFAAAVTDMTLRKEQELHEAEETYRPRLAALATQRDQDLFEAEDRYPRLLRNLEQRYTGQSQQLRQQYEQAKQESQRRYERQWAELTDFWQSGLERFRAALDDIRGRSAELFPDWGNAAAAGSQQPWTPPSAIPPAVCFGQGEVQLARIEGGMPQDSRLRPAQSEFALPMLLPFPQHSLLLLKSAGEGRAAALRAIQAIMLRMLTALPPGKVRFTILDPVGLGENFSVFMHLADFDEQLVASRIWTDSGHIEQRLADLTDHMENVLQVYLRNEFPSIEEYNRSAGEMAEPYRVLVVADFPANFSEAAAQRLKSIVTSGARCGVFVILGVDTKLPAPRGFHLADLEADALALSWNEGHFQWHHPSYGPLPVAIEQPPAAERFADMVRAVGHLVKDASRVEVPFQCIIPAESQWWTADSRAGLDVPLGRAGAMKLQHLNLGKGTSQHVLISGKTGSGKSTLLHVLITNLALRYSPDEIELYLVDFKKGVEFKAYARYGLPHARVIAIESEREFGVSVLQHLDAELRRRGDRFRALGVQDLKGYRTAQPAERLPRIMLIVDEFQELFVDDDRVAQEAALLLDRLVRQGRAFGIHVLLGSQTLGGAYSLARSTIGQMAVRIALQCSEADAHLILSEENTAARLLKRPGEAIYNDANGIYEGNHPFQVVWLADDERDEYLRRIAQRAADEHCTVPRAIVFEGNVLSDPSENEQLHDLLAAPRWPAAGTPAQAWLGSAVAITEPTTAVFLRQSGANLLLAGHREEAALGVMATCLLSLAAQHAPCHDSGKGDSPIFGVSSGDEGQKLGQSPGDGDGARFYVLDGTRPDAPESGFWKRLLPVLPHAARLGLPRDAAALLGEIAAELARRQAEEQDKAPPLYLFIYNLGRFRDLRKEDDFSFGGSDAAAPASPAKQFVTILREGPALGIHTLAWCDSYSTLARLLDRQTLRDFEMRALFQMNATDSSNLMDGPDASRLGVHRAIFYDEAQGRAEKFRPYGLPTEDWLTWVGQQLRSRPVEGC